MVRFISAGVLGSIVSAALVPLSAAAQDSDPAPWWHVALAQTADFTFSEWTITSDFLPEGQPVTVERMRDLQERPWFNSSIFY